MLLSRSMSELFKQRYLCTKACQFSSMEQYPCTSVTCLPPDRRTALIVGSLVYGINQQEGPRFGPWKLHDRGLIVLFYHGLQGGFLSLA